MKNKNFMKYFTEGVLIKISMNFFKYFKVKYFIMRPYTQLNTQDCWSQSWLPNRPSVRITKMLMGGRVRERSERKKNFLGPSWGVAEKL